ncbi:unnamed protein product [Sphagnum balticum]
MKEDLLHFIWRYRLYDSHDLRTTDGQRIEVIQPGSVNTDAGADFSSARIRIGQVMLAGNVEIHVEQNGWYTHHHNEDKAYNNVILHVVYEDSGKPARTQSDQLIPVLCLKDYISAELLHRYDLLREKGNKIPCESMIGRLSPDFSFSSFYDRLVIERLQSKVAVVEGMLGDSTHDWDQVAFRMVAMYFGGPVNKEPFGLLASSLPLQVIHKHRSEPMQIEALLFGQAGMLDTDYDDEYPRMLKREYTYLRKLHSLAPMEESAWKFFRVRPASFPTIKIAQIAAWLIREVHPFSAVMDGKNIAELRNLFDVEVNPYWQTHFQFDKPVKKAIAAPGNMLTDVLLINAVVPLVFSYGRYKDEEDICRRALELLMEIPAEKNAVVRMWDAMGIKAGSANDTQALLQLYNQYCLGKRCLSCQIGHKILSPASVSI